MVEACTVPRWSSSATMRPLRAPVSLDPARAIADLRVLAALTSDDAGAQRVAWTPTWDAARAWLTAQLDEIDVVPTIDEAGNLWAELSGPLGGPVVALGSHLDSVPCGGWLDGALGVVAALEILRAATASGWRRATLRLVDWADEEGARFGHSLFGSSAATGLLTPQIARSLRDPKHQGLAGPAAERGVNLDAVGQARQRLDDVDALLELHIEQGPVLEREGHALGVPLGAVAVHRLRVFLEGRSAHAGTTPFIDRRDAGMAAARIALLARDLAQDGGGLATSGSVEMHPAVATVVPGAALLSIDLRHPSDEGLARMRERLAIGATQIASEERVGLRFEDVWCFPAVRFDADLAGIMADSAAHVTGVAPPLMQSGALHDAVAVARGGTPVAMLFVRSRGGVSHSPEEDTDDDDLAVAIRAYGEAAQQTAETLEQRL
jgi:hydantoinase/carbamoylase family amidase